MTYCFGGAAGASAGGGAAVPSAGGAAGASAAGAAGASAAGAAGAGVSVEAGGAAAVSGLAASCFAQAVSISAATSALRASLVFIDRYPKRSKSGIKTIRTNLVVPRVPYGSQPQIL